MEDINLFKDEMIIKLRTRLHNTIVVTTKSSGKIPCNQHMLKALYEIFLTDCWEAGQIFTFRQLATDFRLPPPKEGKKAIHRESSINKITEVLVQMDCIYRVSTPRSGTLIELIVPDEIKQR